jgi:hypothetical protein
MKKSIILLVFIFFILTLLPAHQALAQDGAWGEVVDGNGNIMYDNMSDQGVVTQTADWMPSITLPGVGTVSVPAEYHSYVTESGNTVLMPTASTLFFMAANPQESGYLAAASTMGTNGAGVSVDAPNGIAGVGAVLASLMGNAGGSEMMSAINQAGFNGPSAAQNFFQSVANGQTDIWSIAPTGIMNFLSSLYTPISTDHNLYTYMLLYTPGQCASTPAGCSASQLTLLPPIAPTPPPVTVTPPPPPKSPCPDSSVKPGVITSNASEVAPPYPLVVGQDPDRRGVDVVFSASVAPTIYTYYTAVPIYSEEECTILPCSHRKVIIGYTCVKHVISYPECIASASASISLSQESREWILNELSIRYPEAYLHHPNFSFSGSGCVWSASQDHVQVADPGNWNMLLSGHTSGTPVSGSRSFSRRNIFTAWLKEVVIVK